MKNASKPMLEIPVLSKLRIRYKLMVVLCVIAFMAMFILLTSVITEPLHRYILLGVTIFLPVLLKFTRQRDIIGKVILSADTIAIRTGPLNENIPTGELGIITIKYKGYEGKTKGFYPPQAPHTGNNNLITFTYNGVDHDLRIFLSRSDIAPLNEIIDQWKAQNISVPVRGKFGKVA